MNKSVRRHVCRIVNEIATSFCNVFPTVWKDHFTRVLEFLSAHDRSCVVGRSGTHVSSALKRVLQRGRNREEVSAACRSGNHESVLTVLLGTLQVQKETE